MINHPKFNLTYVRLMFVPNSKLYNRALSQGFIANKIYHNLGDFTLGNTTKMNDEEYNIINTLYKYVRLGFHLPSALKIELDRNKMKVYAICPHCEKTNSFQLIDDKFNFTLLPFTCSNCYGQGKIVTHKLISKLLFSKTIISELYADYVNKSLDFKHLYNIINTNQ